MTIINSIRVRLPRAWRAAWALNDEAYSALRAFANLALLPRVVARPRTIRCRKRGRDFCLHLGGFRDVNAIIEVFCDGDYRSCVGEPRTIVDLGAHIGISAIYFALRYPNAKITAVEPNPHNLAYLVQNASQFPNIKVIEGAIAEKVGTVTMSVDDDRTTMGSAIVKYRNLSKTTDVKAITLRLLREHIGASTIDMLKFDIEGAEYDVFSVAEARDGIAQFVGEFHEDLTRRSISDFLVLFGSYSLKVKQIAQGRYIVAGIVRPRGDG